MPNLHCCLFWLILSIGLAAFLPTAYAGGLNDTGQDRCFDGINLVTCTEANTGDSSPYPRQDGRYGRDAQASAGRLTKIGGGMAGFDFTTLDTNGNPTTPTSGANPHPCVRDNVTGLMWEVKTNDGGLRDMKKTYTWDNAPSYATAVNAAGLCGFHDWRMPNLKELAGIVDYSIPYPGPTINTGYFPNTQSTGFWSSVFAYPGSPWGVAFGSGYVAYGSRSDDAAIRLVRGGQAFVSLTDNGNGTVTDNSTGLMWEQCSEGQSGTGCAGSAAGMTWADALTAARNSRLGGYSDWRLPNVKELQSIVEYGVYIPFIDLAKFPNTLSTWYWTSSSYASDSSGAWYVDLGYGHVYYDNRNPNLYGLAVRLVRGGQSFDFLNLPPSPINGTCGEANGQTLASAPSSDLCYVGTASAVSGFGPWSWMCSGSNGGSSASCTAFVAMDPSGSGGGDPDPDYGDGGVTSPIGDGSNASGTGITFPGDGGAHVSLIRNGTDTNDSSQRLKEQQAVENVVLGGYRSIAGTRYFAMARYKTDGGPDTTFGKVGTGEVITQVGISTDMGYTLATQPDGKILLGGSSFSDGNTNLLSK